MKNWEDEIILPKKDSSIKYAYWLDTKTTPTECSEEELYNTLKNFDNIMYVATPEHDTFIIPGSDFITLLPILIKRRTNIKANLKFAIFCTIVFGLFVLYSVFSEGSFDSNSSAYLQFIIFGIIPILSSMYELSILKKINEVNYLKESSEIKFDFWVRQKTVIFIYIFTGIIILISISQFIIGLNNSVESVGLVKENTKNGEYWRLLTCTLVHGGLLHIMFNASAMYSIGKMIIRISGVSYFLIVFLISGIIGSLFSLILLDETSVGSSGGIMGLIGFILIIAIKFKNDIPRNILKSTLTSILLIGMLGVFAFDIIDNAAHFGGLLGGILIGILLTKKKQNNIPYKSNRLIKISGIFSAIVLILGIIITITKLIQ